MCELVATVVVVVGVLVLVALLGHGLWLAAVSLFGGGERRTLPMWMDRKHCPRCQCALSEPNACGVCNWPRPTANAGLPRVLQQLRRQVMIFAHIGMISEAERQELFATLCAGSPLLREQPAIAVTAVEEPIAEVIWLDGDEAVNKSSAAAPTPLSAAIESQTQAEAEVARETDVPTPTEPFDPQERVRQYVEHRQAEGVSISAAPAVIEQPAPVRRERLGALLATFLEERNVRWGELVGGLLIVCCSIALVISFWSEIAARPLMKFCVFNSVSAALFGAGFYTERHWKIYTTSRGMLIIAILLVPLNFLAIAAFTDKSPPTDILSLGGEGLSLALFTALTYLAARVLTPEAAGLAAIGVMAPSLLQLLTRRFAGTEASPAVFYTLAAAPIATYVAVSGFDIRRLAHKPEFDERDANRLFMLLGIVTFAAMLPLALLLHKMADIGGTVHRLSPLLVLLGMPALTTGALFWKRREHEPLSSVATAGIGIGVFGALVMLTALVLAFPMPARIVPTALVNIAVFAFIAWWLIIPEVHLAAAACGTIAWLAAHHVIRGAVGWRQLEHGPLIDALLSASSGKALLPLVAGYIAISYCWLRAKRAADAYWWRAAGIAVALASLALIFLFGFARSGDPQRVAGTLALYAVATLAAAITTDHLIVAWAGAGLLLATLLQALAFGGVGHPEIAEPWAFTMLVVATAAIVIRIALSRFKPRENVFQVLWEAALIASAGAVAFGGIHLGQMSWSSLAAYLTWLTAVWVTLATMGRLPALLAASQIASLLAVCCAATARFTTEDWYAMAERPWLDPWFLEGQGIALAALCVMWELALRAARRFVLGSRPAATTDLRQPRFIDILSEPIAFGVVRIVQGGVIVLAVALAVYAVAPGACQEMSPQDERGLANRVVPAASDFEFAGMPHEHAAGAGAWLLLAASAMMAVSELWSERRNVAAIGLLVLAAAACCLFATRWADVTSVASALRWLTAGLFASGAVLLWSRQKISPHVARWGIIFPGNASTTSSHLVVYCYQAIFLLTGLLYVTLVGYTSLAALRKTAAWGVPTWLLESAAVIFLLGGLAGLALKAIDKTESLGKNSRRSILSKLVLCLAAVPFVVILGFAIATALKEHPIVGPEPGTFFRRIGFAANYAIPVTLISLVLLTSAIRERAGSFVVAGGLLLNLAATLVYLQYAVRKGRGLNASLAIEVVQIAGLMSAVVTLAWLAAWHWERRRRRAGELDRTAKLPPTLLLQTAIAAAFWALWLAPATIGLFVNGLPRGWIATAGGPLGLAGSLFAATMLWRSSICVSPEWTVHRRGLALSAVAAMLALVAAWYDRASFLGVHVLLLSVLAAAWWMALAAGGALRKAIDPYLLRLYSAWAEGLAVVAFAMAMRGLPTGASAWWTIAPLAVLSALAVWLAWTEQRRRPVWVAGLLLNLAGSIWWIQFGYRLTRPRGVAGLLEFVLLNVIVAAIGCLGSVIVERRRRVTPTELRRGFATFHRVVTWLSIIVMFLLTAASLTAHRAGVPGDPHWLLRWGATAALAAAALACFWDATAGFASVKLYLVGLIVVGQFLDSLHASGQLFDWSLTLALAAFALATSYLWTQRGKLESLVARFGPPRTGPIASPAFASFNEPHWLVGANSLLALAVTALVFWIELSDPVYSRRMVAAYAILAAAMALACLAQGAVRSQLQFGSLVLGVLFAVAFGWAWLPLEIEALGLHRLIVAAAALTVVIPAYGLGLAKLWRQENEWTAASRRLVPSLTFIDALLVLLVVVIEALYVAQEGVAPVRMPALIAVAVSFVWLIAAALMTALLPGRDPFGLSERGRTAYVYAAEAVLALLGVHVRLTMPWLFHGWFIRFWPLVVMGIAFFGVGLSEFWRRRRRAVLYEPLENTGAFLPLLPVLGYWLLPSRINYSLLLLSVGALYSVLSVLRRSFLFGLLATLAANGSLWYLLQSAEGLGLLEHPQLWLIPPALCVLAAAYLNRSRLTTEQMTGIRYACAIVIYASSTADIFVNGVGEAPWLPLVLAGLSILGIFAGILFRVQAFLYLGFSFLLVSLFTVVWYAAVEQQRTWIWWVSGIVTGTVIIALFGLFEKKREEVLRLAERVRQWEA